MTVNKPNIVKFGDIAETISDTHRFDRELLIFLNTSDIYQGKVLHRSYSSVKEMPGQAKKSIKKGDILFSEIRPANGRYAFIDFDADDYVVSTKLMVIRAINGVNPKYLYYYLISKPVTNLLQHLAESRSGTFPQITYQQVADLDICLPSDKEQGQIVSLAETVDNKIELNHKMNETLEAIAKAIFKSWFVDFDPVHAKMAGKKPVGMDDSTAALFPDSFEDSELKKIPKEWKLGSLAEHVDIYGGGTPKTAVTEYWNGDIPWFSVVDSPNPSDVFVINTEKKITKSGLNNSSTQLLSAGTTIITARGTVGELALTGVPMTMNQSCYGLKHKEDNLGYYTYYLVENILETLKSRTHGSVFDTITRDTLASISVVLPPQQLINKYSNCVHTTMNRILNNMFETGTLTEIRNLLLPKLLSGEIELRG